VTKLAPAARQAALVAGADGWDLARELTLLGQLLAPAHTELAIRAVTARYDGRGQTETTAWTGPAAGTRGRGRPARPRRALGR
jgi:hypothetical protein